MFNIDMIREAAAEQGFAICGGSDHQVEVLLKDGFVLVFQNMPGEGDTSVFFKDDGAWHSHGDLFAHHYGVEEELVTINVLHDLKRGRLLISVSQFRDGTRETSLVFADQIGDVNYHLGAGEQITFMKLA